MRRRTTFKPIFILSLVQFIYKALLKQHNVDQNAESKQRPE